MQYCYIPPSRPRCSYGPGGGSNTELYDTASAVKVKCLQSSRPVEIGTVIVVFTDTDPAVSGSS